MKPHHSTRPGATVPGRMPRVYLRVTRELQEGYFGSYYVDRVVVGDRDESKADLVSSELLDGRKHAPALDIDVPAYLIHSSTPGHSHLYIDVAMSWWRYRRLLKALWKAGIIEKGYYRASIKRKATHLRHPRLTKDVL